MPIMKFLNKQCLIYSLIYQGLKEIKIKKIKMNREIQEGNKNIFPTEYKLYSFKSKYDQD